MLKADNSTLFKSLRQQYTHFVYEGFSIKKNDNSLNITYKFNLSDIYFFNPTLTIPLNPIFTSVKMSDEAIESLAFHIGMVEMLSYWKAACPAKIIIKDYYLEPWQEKWWKKLYYYGLGEFFYLNGIDICKNDFVSFSYTNKKKTEKFRIDLDDKNLIPVGGGKDSAVTYDILSKAKHNNVVFFLNPQHVAVEVVSANNINPKTITAYRNICPNLLELNKKGFLNGHTPFSAVLAFISLLISGLSNCKNIVLSNESSANEATVVGTKINHQYSKTLEFEEDFRTYVKNCISPDYNYFSFLRPVNELQIGYLFSKAPYLFSKFRSCNVGSKKGKWCCHCPKCLFTFIILAPFIKEKTLEGIFGNNLWTDSALLTTFKQLIGIEDIKPFECIGTLEEVNMALTMVINKYENTPLPYLLNYYASSDLYKKYKKKSPKYLLEYFDNKNFLNTNFENLLKDSLNNNLS